MILSHIDPLGSKIGGTKSFINGLVENAPDDFLIEWVGISTNRKERPVGKWQKIQIGSKYFNFLPVLFIKNENKKTKLPLILYYLLSVIRYKSIIPLENRILNFHRIEPSIIFRNSLNKKLLFIHGNIKKIYDLHYEGKWRKLPFFYFKMEEKLISKMEKIFVVSREGLEFYKKKYSYIRNNFCFMPTFVDNKKFHPYYSKIEKEKDLLSFKEENGFIKKDKLIIFVGRLESSKNPLFLLKTFKYLRKNNAYLKLLIVGTGNLKNKLVKKISEYGLWSEIKLFDAIPNYEVAKLLRISDVFLMTSEFEGMPVSVLEALASGLPVVSTDVGEVKKVVKDNFSGRLVQKHYKENIAEAVLEVLGNGEKYTSNNCVNSVKKYSINNVLDSVYKVHYNLIV